MNPDYKKLTYQLKTVREKKARVEANVYKRIEENGQTSVENIMKKLTKSTSLIEQINEYNDQIKVLLVQRKKTPSRITIAEMPPEYRYNKLKQESKKLKNAIIMIAYRAETALFNILSEHYKNNDNEGRQILKEIFTSDADMIPDYKNQTLTVRLHSLSTPRANQAVKKLCDFLNQTETQFPYTDLKLIYETVAL